MKVGDLVKEFGDAGRTGISWQRCLIKEFSQHHCLMVLWNERIEAHLPW